MPRVLYIHSLGIKSVRLLTVCRWHQVFKFLVRRFGNSFKIASVVVVSCVDCGLNSRLLAADSKNRQAAFWTQLLVARGGACSEVERWKEARSEE